MENAEVIDRMSNLPDELFVLILSFLPVKDAFSNMLVSKRWTAICKLLPGCYCNDKSVKNENDLFLFSFFVSKALSFRKNLKKIHLHCESRLWKECSFNNIQNLIRFEKRNPRANHSSCTIKFDFSCSFKNMEYWILFAKLHPLENLHLSSVKFNWDDNIITLPTTIFTFPTLVVLKLTNFNLYGNISVDLPLLKTLHLNHVLFTDHENFYKLLYGCPILEDLIAHVTSIDPHLFTVNTRESKTLSKLIRADIDDSTVHFTTIYNVQSLKHHVVLNFPSQNIYSDCKTFQNLIHLELSIRCYFKLDAVASEDHHYLENVMGLLHNCPKLQIFSISQRIYEKFFGVWKYPSCVPNCISSHLKSCSINFDNNSCYFDNFVVDLQLARYILMNAPLLELMEINIVESAKKRANAIQELFQCPRVSHKCKISISGKSF